MLKVILGKSKTGKTTYIYNQIEDNISQKKRVILFVPSQSRAKAENEYMKILNKKGVIGVNITTISEFIKEELKIQNLHISEKYMSRLDRKVILTQVIKENPELFNIFSKVKNYPGFLDTLDIYMDLFRKGEITPEEYSSIEIKDKRVNLKFKEILSVYAKYIEKIKENYIDSVDECELFLSSFSKSEWFKDNNVIVFFDAYNNFSNSEYKLIDKLFKNNIDVVITLNTDIARIEDAYISSSIFEESNKTYKKLLRLADKNDIEVENIVKYENKFEAPQDIKYIANNLFNTNEKVEEKIELNNVKFVMYTNILKEVEAVANTISQYIKQGYRYSDFIIYTTNIDEYYKIINRAFYEHSMQVYSAQSRYITESILVKYILALLNLSMKGLNLELIFDILKLGLTDIDLKDIYILENYMKEFNVNKYLVNSKFTLNNQKNFYNLERLNEIKEKIVSMYSFTKELRNLTAKEYVEKIYAHLEKNNIFNNFEEIVKPIVVDTTNVDRENFEKQVWDGICEIFDSIIRIYNDTELKVEEFTNIFSIVLKDVKIKTLPPLKDQIELADVNVTKTEPKKIAFFVGVVEGKFPKKVEEDIFFLDSELEKLKEKNIEIRETTISKLNMGFFNIYEAMNNIEEKLYIFIPSATLDGKATRKSSLITLMEQISRFYIEGQVTAKDENISIENISSKDELFMWLLKNIRIFDTLDDNQKQEVITVFEYFKQDAEYNKILEFKKDDSNLSEELLSEIYSKDFKSSVSKLEAYKKCPFMYYMQYILKVDKNKEAKLNVMELGNFMHGVLEDFSKYLLENGINWKEILTEDLEQIQDQYEVILEGIIEDRIDSILSKQKQSVKYVILKRKLTNTMKKVIRTVAIGFYQSDFEPLGYEIEFKDDSLYFPMEIELNGNRKMKLVGKIDRADILDLGDEKYIRIVDYKSNYKDISVDKIREGISLQLITYLMTLIEDKKEENIKPAGLLYFNLSDKLVPIGQYENDTEVIKKKLIKKLKMNGLFVKNIEILNKMDRNFESDPSHSLIEVSKKSMSMNSPKLVSEEEFETLCNETKEVLKSIGNEIVKGIVKIAPNKKANPCQYCNYSATCRRRIGV